MGYINSTQQQQYYEENESGSYQFTSLDNVINQFMVAYVGEDKLISKVKRVDVAFHAQRALQELSFDTLKSTKAQEITLPPSLMMQLPKDYVNYTKVSWVDSSGVKHLLYPASKTSNPSPILQNTDGSYPTTASGTFENITNPTTIVLDAEYGYIQVGMLVSGSSIATGSKVVTASTASSITTITIDNNVTSTATETLTFSNSDGSLILEQESTTWANYKSGTPSESNDDYEDDTYWPMDGSRYGLDPQYAQANGSFYVDENMKHLHFSSNISGKTVILDYISDSLGTDGEMQVHKFAEEAMYKCIIYAILSTRANVQEYIVRRFKK